MTTHLHLTNGTAIIPAMREAGVHGTIVPWNDVLHEGPVPQGLGVAALRERRAEFIAACGWVPLEAARRAFIDRDTALEQAIRGAAASPPGHRVDEIVLWLEHDLYDQLQRLQILDRVPLDGAPRITAVPDDDYLGMQSAARFATLFELRREVTSAERLAARDAWTAFRADDPTRLLEVMPRVTALRHLGPALMRHLEQFPGVSDGLSRTERHALEAIAGGVDRVGELFTATQRREAAMFMGDTAFLVHVGSLLRTPAPLIATDHGGRDLRLDDRVALTADGRAVLDGRADRVRLSGIDRWLGGVALAGTGPVWRWDAEQQRPRFL
jgi:hypothetical protein